MPAFLKDSEKHVHHLVLRVEQEVARTSYPRPIYEATAGLVSAAASFPKLQTCLLQVDFTFLEDASTTPIRRPNLNETAGSKIQDHERPCRKGFSGTSTVDAKLALLLLGAFAVSGLGKYRSFRLVYVGKAQDRGVGKIVTLPAGRFKEPEVVGEEGSEDAKLTTPAQQLLVKAKVTARARRVVKY